MMEREYTVSENSSTWRKSSRSGGNTTGDCVEVTVTEQQSA